MASERRKYRSVVSSQIDARDLRALQKEAERIDRPLSYVIRRAISDWAMRKQQDEAAQ